MGESAGLRFAKSRLERWAGQRGNVLLRRSPFSLVSWRRQISTLSTCVKLPAFRLAYRLYDEVFLAVVCLAGALLLLLPYRALSACSYEWSVFHMKKKRKEQT